MNTFLIAIVIVFIIFIVFIVNTNIVIIALMY
jgi:hypothetical protein